MVDTEAKIAELLQKVAHKPLELAKDESLFESGLLDSFALPDLVGELEKAFAIKIPDNDLRPRTFDTIERIQAYIEKHKG